MLCGSRHTIASLGHRNDDDDAEADADAAVDTHVSEQQSPPSHPHARELAWLSVSQ